MAIQQRRTHHSILLTLKVLQFVNQLRRRLKPRVQSAAGPSPLGAEACLGLESKALRSFTKGLSRVGPQERKPLNHASDRVCKSRNKHRTRPSLKLQTPGKDDPAIQNISGGEVQHMLDSVDEKLSPPESALSAVASDDRLFLKQNTAANFDACSLNETIQSLVVVHDALKVLYACRAQYDDEWLVAQGREAGLNFDEAFIANYEHLLLRLQTELVDALGRKVLEALLLGSHDKKQRRLLAWFTEFADKPRPLSTFPWTIKPSLAVLWGVCWMFYNPSGRPNGPRDNHRVPQAALLQNMQLPQWGSPGSTDYLNFGIALTGTQPQPAAQQQGAGNSGSGSVGGGDLRFEGVRNTESWMPIPSHLESTGLGPRQGRSRVSAMPPNQFYYPGLNTTYCPQFPPAGPQSINPDLRPLPPNSGPATTLTVFPLDASSSYHPWHQLRPSSLPQRTARPLTSNIPTVQVTGTPELAAPQPDFAAPQYNNISQINQEPQAPELSIFTEPYFDNSSFTNMGNCPPPEMHISQRHERTPSNSTPNIPTPVSMAHHSPLASPIDRVGDRKLSITSTHHSRDVSEDPSSQGDEDAGSPRRNHAYKRSEEPPRNAEGKMTCKHTECASLTFDRKCEWSKHMDKHDRPYKCNVKGCEKLQGFTYSGGLLRHEREVHKMHGGTKKSLFCPFTDCKRSSGSGFTRKENLAEHIRRVHRRTSMSADLGHLIVPRSDPADDSPRELRRSSEAPYQRLPESADEDSQFALKRKRVDQAGIEEEPGEPDLRAEIKRLRRENEEKDARLRQLEEAVMVLQQGRR